MKNNEINYITNDSEILHVHFVSSFGEAKIVSNTYENSQGTIVFNKDVTEIGENAFYDCKSLESINIPEGVTKIGEGAFVFCSSLTSINIPKSVTTIGESAFEGCISLKSVNIPKSVTEIGLSAFGNCGFLQSNVCFKALDYDYKGLYTNPLGKMTYFKVGKKTVVKGKIEMCKNGIHFCRRIQDVFNHYFGYLDKDFKIAIVEPVGEVIEGGDKSVAQGVKVKKILTKNEIIDYINRR